MIEIVEVIKRGRKEGRKYKCGGGVGVGGSRKKQENFLMRLLYLYNIA